MKKLTRERVVRSSPPGFPGNRRNVGFAFTRLAKFRHQQEYPSQALLAGVEELIDKIGLVLMLRASKNFRKTSANAGWSCITWVISSRVILSATHELTAVAVADAAQESTPVTPLQRSRRRRES